MWNVDLLSVCYRLVRLASLQPFPKKDLEKTNFYITSVLFTPTSHSVLEFNSPTYHYVLSGWRSNTYCHLSARIMWRVFSRHIISIYTYIQYNNHILRLPLSATVYTSHCWTRASLRGRFSTGLHAVLITMVSFTRKFST